MKRAALITILVLLLSTGLGAVPPSGAVYAEDGQVVPGQYIVKLAPGADTATARELGRLYGLTIQYTYSHAFHGFAAHIPDAQLARLQANPYVVSIVPDRYVVMSVKPVKPTPTPRRRLHRPCRPASTASTRS